MAFGLIGFLIMGYVIVSILSRKKFPTTRVSGVDLQKNAFLKFLYKTNDASGKKVVITAEKVIEETKDNFIFEKVTSNFMPPNEETGTITSNFGKVIRGARSVCEFRDNVIMTTKSGILLLTYIAAFDSEKVFKTTYRKRRRFLKASLNILDMFHSTFCKKLRFFRL